jgi:hypothetical protein
VGTLGAIQFLETFLAVRYAILFKEISGTQWFSAVPTHEMLRVITPAKCLNDFSEDSLSAGGTGTSARGILTVNAAIAIVSTRYE